MELSDGSICLKRGLAPLIFNQKVFVLNKKCGFEKRKEV